MKTLTKSQAEAVASESPLTVLIAGPGSGKTGTIVERIIHLLSNNLAVPAEIMIVTFTNAAAREIEERLAKEYDGQILFHYCGTLHGYMLRLMKQHGQLIGFKTRIAMLDEEQQKALLDDVVRDMKIKAPMKDIRAALAVGPERYMIDKAGGGRAPDGLFFVGVELIAYEYYRRIMHSGLLDFDSLLQFGALLARELKKTGVVLPFKYLFWDEFQDSGKEDAAIFEAFSAATRFVVGDPDQSIYGWRGGRPEFLLGLMKNYDAKVIYLHENFRCDGGIARSANQLIAVNENTHCVTLSTTGKDGEVWITRQRGEVEEQKEIAESIRSQADVNQCAILVRSRALVDRLSKAMESFGIPVVKVERGDKPSDWRVARSLINLFANPDNDLLADWWIQQQKDTKFANRIKLEALQGFTSINRHYLKLPTEVKVRTIPAALAKSGIGQESIDLVNKAIALLPIDATIAELSFALGDDELHKKETGQGLTVTTIHSAKGREWDCVYLPAFEDGTIPVHTKTSTVEEERRLAFVGITRARHKLYVSFAQMRKPAFGGYKPEPTTPSPFVDEMRRGEQAVNKPSA